MLVHPLAQTLGTARRIQTTHTITLSWETGRAVIDALWAKGLPSMLEHADHLERQLDQHAPDEPTVSLRLTDDVFLRSFNWARVELGIPLAAEYGPTPISGAINHTRHQASASSSVLPEKS